MLKKLTSLIREKVRIIKFLWYFLRYKKNRPLRKLDIQRARLVEVTFIDDTETKLVLLYRHRQEYCVYNGRYWVPTGIYNSVYIYLKNPGGKNIHYCVSVDNGLYISEYENDYLDYVRTLPTPID